MIKLEDRQYMERALRLARRALGRTRPNPMVGCVLVRDGAIVGEGYHHAAGQPHAEVMAIRDAGEKAEGATAYVSLEPCSHFGRTPPCTDALIDAGIVRVVAAMEDPNPMVAGQGFAKLKAAGIVVDSGLMEEKARELNEVHIKYSTTGLPFVLLKMAMSLDGKIATRTGNSRWITGERARREVHRLRRIYSAVLVGIGTILADDPVLTARHRGPGQDPVRVIVDGLAETPLDARVIVSSSKSPVVIAATDDAPEERITALRNAGAEVVRVSGCGQIVDMKALMRLLGEQGIDSILVEGGGQIAAAALEAGMVDKVLFFYAPKIIGGANAVTSVEGAGAGQVTDSICLERITVRRFGDDTAIQGYIIRNQ